MSLNAVYPHRIRLRGPWECEPIDGPPAHRVTMPCGWIEAGLEGFRGETTFTRKFGYPGNIDETERVWLTCDGCSGVCDIKLNSHQLAKVPNGTFAFDVTSILGPRNSLEVRITGKADDAGLWGEIALEIRKSAYLDGVSLQMADGVLQVKGIAIGAMPQALELYTLVDRKHVDYRTILPTQFGTPFAINLTEIAPASQTVRLELINVSSIWYVVEVPISHLNSQ